MEALFGRHPGEEADGKGLPGAVRSPECVPFQIDTQGRDPDLRGRDSKILRHIVGVVLTHRQKRIDVNGRFTNQIQRLRSIRLSESVKEQVFSLQRAADRNLQCAAQWLGETNEERVWQVHDVKLRLASKPVEQLADFLSLKSPFSAQHGNRQL